MDRLTASSPGYPTADVRPKAKRWSSDLNASLSTGTFLQIPDQQSAYAYKVQVMKAEDFLVHSCKLSSLYCSIPHLHSSTADKMREDLLLSFICAYSHFGASLSALEDVILEASHKFDINVTVIRQKGVITCYVGERMNGRRYIRTVGPVILQSHFLGLREVHKIYATVLEQKMRVGEAREQLAALCEEAHIHRPGVYLLATGVLSGLICRAFFAGSSHDVAATVVATAMLSGVHYLVHKASQLNADFLE